MPSDVIINPELGALLRTGLTITLVLIFYIALQAGDRVVPIGVAELCIIITVMMTVNVMLESPERAVFDRYTVAFVNRDSSTEVLDMNDGFIVYPIIIALVGGCSMIVKNMLLKRSPDAYF